MSFNKIKAIKLITQGTKIPIKKHQLKCIKYKSNELPHIVFCTNLLQRISLVPDAASFYFVSDFLHENPLANTLNFN